MVSNSFTPAQPGANEIKKKINLVGFLLVEGEDVGVHQGPSRLAENLRGLGQELNFDPRDVEVLARINFLLKMSVKKRIIIDRYYRFFHRFRLNLGKSIEMINLCHF